MAAGSTPQPALEKLAGKRKKSREETSVMRVVRWVYSEKRAAQRAVSYFFHTELVTTGLAGRYLSCIPLRKLRNI